MNNGLLILPIILGSFWFIKHRLLRYLRYFQQEEYDPRRFFQWLIRYKAFDKKGSLMAFSAACIDWILGNSLLVSLCGAAFLIGIAAFEENPFKQGKLRLKMTERAVRLYRLALALSLLAALCLALICTFFASSATFWAFQPLLFQLTPAWLIVANLLLHRNEQKRQKQFLNEAKSILAKVSPYVIGITGSYGKTSTKDALSQILQITLAPTFWPPKGINTPMGITREIRTKLKEGFRYAVIEMGAYGRGSIQRLCDLTPPQAAIITAIGTAHLERFGSKENIYLAKSELAQAVPKEGILVCNGDDEGARRIASQYPKKTTLLYGFDNIKEDLDCWISAWKITPKGSQFTIKWKNHHCQGFTPLLGKPALSNAIGAFTMACALGSQPEYVLAVLANLDPIDNRLQLKKAGSVIYLHDAYNSNPIGFAAALEVMASLPGQRRLMMTPGIIELGTKQYEENEHIGRLAAQVCDLAIIVGETNREAIVNGLLAGGLTQKQLLICPTRDNAFEQLKHLQRDGDIILIENDLSDLYEAVQRF